jgi:hypothetical protein
MRRNTVRGTEGCCAMRRNTVRGTEGCCAMRRNTVRGTGLPLQTPAEINSRNAVGTPLQKNDSL